MKFPVAAWVLMFLLQACASSSSFPMSDSVVPALENNLAGIWVWQTRGQVSHFHFARVSSGGASNVFVVTHYPNQAVTGAGYELLLTRAKDENIARVRMRALGEWAVNSQAPPAYMLARYRFDGQGGLYFQFLTRDEIIERIEAGTYGGILKERKNNSVIVLDESKEEIEIMCPKPMGQGGDPSFPWHGPVRKISAPFE